jgi:DNA polymerase V
MSPKSENEAHGTTVALMGCVAEGEAKAPLYSSRPQAGFPAPGDDQVERVLDINDLVVKHPASTFYVRVEGDSMEGAGIFSNDVLVVDRSLIPKDGSIVVAAVYGEMVVKRLVVRNGQHSLASENPNYTPIEVNGNDDCFIWGVVVGSVRQFI